MDLYDHVVMGMIITHTLAVLVGIGVGLLVGWRTWKH